MSLSGRAGYSRRAVVSVALVGALIQMLSMRSGSAQVRPTPLSVADDWTHRHVIFSGPRSAREAQRLRFDARYRHQWLLHNVRRPLAGTNPAAAGGGRFADLIASIEAARDGQGPDSFGPARSLKPSRPKGGGGFARDWGMSLGVGGTVGAEMFPAKFSFDVNAAPDCQNDFVVFNTSLAGLAGTKASRTGSFTASSLTGTVTVNGTTLTASPGTAASQITTIGANNVASGNTITITNANTAATLTLTASAPVAEIDRIAFGTTPSNSSSVTIAAIAYVFKTSNWTSGTETSTQCFVRTGTSSQMVSRLASAITTGSANTGASVSTWECGSAANQPGNGVTVTGSTSPNVDVTARIPGSTGFTPSTSGTTNLTITVTTSGTDGSSISPNFQYWSGAAPAPAATLATNIINAIGGAAAVGVGASSAGSAAVKIAATATGLAGNNISVATSIASGLSGDAFNGSLTGGAAGTTSGTTFSTSTDSATTSVNVAAEAAALAAAIEANVPAVDANSSNGVVTVTAANAGADGNSIALAETFASGFTWAGSSLAGGVDGRSSVVAFNQLYSRQGSAGGTCSQDGPSAMWAYNTGSGTVVTSTVLSLDGTKIIYVESKASGALLHILRWQAGEGTVGGPVIPAVSLAGLDACPASGSCDVQIPLVGAPQVTNSSPFYDYSLDALYVGDDAGRLHKFFPVLNGPVQEAGGAWPILVHGSTVLSSPVLDGGSGNIFIGDAAGTLSYVRETFSTVGSACTLPCVGTPAQSLGGAIVDAPTVDSSTGRLFVVEGKDSTNHGAVYQFDTALSTPSKKTAAIGGNSSSSTYNIHSGAFDQTYLTSADGTGHLFVCGKASGVTERPALHRISLSAGLMNTASDGSLGLASSSSEECSPVTEVYNAATSTDWIFFSVGDNASQTGAGCASSEACLMSLNVTGAAWPPGAASQGFPLPNAKPASGIIVDNVAASSVSTTLAISATTTVSNAGLTTSTTTFDVASAASFAVGDYVQINSEKMLVTGRNTSGQDRLTVTRAQLGTVAATHANGSTVSDLTTVATATTVRVASTTGFVAGDFAQIESEIVKVGAVGTCSLPSSPCLTSVTRGQLGTTAAAHMFADAIVDLTAPETSSIYFSTTANSTSAIPCSAASGVGCALKLTQVGLR